VPGLAARVRIIVVAIALLAGGGLGAFIWFKSKQVGVEPATPATNVATEPTPVVTPTLDPTPSPSILEPSPTPVATPQSEPGLSDPAQTNTSQPSTSFVGTVNLIIPVAGVRADQLLDTFTDARSEGRSHDAIDIMAPAGTPVLAASDGEITKLFQSDRGGTTIYQLSPDKKLVFYYAHLQRYADGLYAGKYVRQGEVIAFVGDTGNAGSGNYHLHFSIAVLNDPKRYWEGTNINPYPMLKK